MLLTPSSQANTLVEKQHTSLIEAHKPGCPWKTRQCDRELPPCRLFSALTQNEASIYRIPLQPPTATVKGIKAVAISLSELLKDVIIKHPLVCKISLKVPLSSNSPSLLDPSTGELSEGDHNNVFSTCKFRGRTTN